MMAEISYDKKEFKKLCEKYLLSIVILHGSYAKGIGTEKSDIDIGFLGDPLIIKDKYFDIIKDFSGIFGERFDPVFLNSKEAMITYQVALNGVPLYEKKKGLFVEFRL
ncbi:MAG: nucleotidyltransferase domain-containing protein, partial [Candidatus Melainabacteria bacterium]|nr:nucleotidyltransferase domain-containing protein [Candidatus Melainabacteria bacterium]